MAHHQVSDFDQGGSARNGGREASRLMPSLSRSI